MSLKALIEKTRRVSGEVSMKSISPKESLSILRKYDVSLWILDHVGAFPLLNEINSIYHIPLQVNVFSFRHLNWLEEGSHCCDKAWSLVLEVLDALKLLRVHNIRELYFELRG